MSVSSIPAMYGDSNVDGESRINRMINHNIRDIHSVEMWRACLGEFLGMFLLCFLTIACGISKDGDPHAPLLQAAIGTGFFISIIITALTTVSGGHVNPAVSIGFFVANEISFVRFVFYSLFQMIGSVVGVACLQACLPSEYHGKMGLIVPSSGVEWHQALGMEFVITAFLMFPIMSFVDKGRKDVGGSIPYQVGLIVAVNILAAGKISGGAMNPARAFASAIMVGDFHSHWIYWVGPMFGGVAGAWLYDNVFSTQPFSFIERGIRKAKKREQLQENGDVKGSYDDNELAEINDNASSKLTT